MEIKWENYGLKPVEYSNMYWKIVTRVAYVYKGENKKE
jgi:hypothetical protein